MRRSIPYLIPFIFVALTALGATYVRFQDHTPASTITTTDGLLVHVFSATEVQFTTLAQVFALAENNFGQLVVTGGIDCATLSVSGGIDASSLGSGIDAVKIALGVVDNTEFGALDGVSGTLVGTESTQTLTNKEMSADANTFSNFDNAEIKDNAGINPTKIATGIVDATEFEFLNGVTSVLLGGDEAIAYASDVFTANIKYASNVDVSKVKSASDVFTANIKYASDVDSSKVKSASDVFTANIAYASDVFTANIKYASNTSVSVIKYSSNVFTANVAYASDVFAANIKYASNISLSDSVSGKELDGVFSTTGLLLRTGAATYSTTTNNSTNWDTAYTDRNKWDGSSVAAGTVVDLQLTETAYFDLEYDNGNSSTADTVDWNNGNKQKSTLTGNVTYTFTAPAGPTNLVLKLIQDGTGNRTTTWPATVKWAGGTAPTTQATANKVHIVCFYYDGTNYYGVASLDMK